MSFIVKYSQISLHQLFIQHEILNPLYLAEHQGALDIPRCDSVMVTDSAFPPDIYHLKMTGRQSILSPTVWDRSSDLWHQTTGQLLYYHSREVTLGKPAH